MRIEPLDDADHLSLTTFDRSGNPRRTGARFAGTSGRFVLALDDDAEALDDLTADDRVEIATGTSSGDVVPGAAVLAGTARLVDGTRIDDELGRIRKKYSLARRAADAGANLWHKARGTERELPVLVEVTVSEAI